MNKGMEIINNEAINEAMKWENAKDNIVFRFINTGVNREELAKRPHREWNDLSIVYQLFLKEDGERMASTKVYDNVMQNMGVTEDDLYLAALKNTKHLFGCTVTTLEDQLKESAIDMGIPKEEVDKMFSTPMEEQQWVISNKIKNNGAIMMLYDDVLEYVAKKLGSDLYILPSSIHEVIALSADKGDSQDFVKMVEEVNDTQVSPEERLSYNVYHYSRTFHRVTVVSE